MNKLITIAIDGPAGAGKTTIAKLLSKKLNILYLNTGAMYRALGYKCKVLALDPEKTEVANYIAENTFMKIKYENGEQHIFIDGNDVNNFLYSNEISKYASLISKHQKIRELCVKIQREVAKTQSVIVDGRDIGTVVLKDAKHKFYLDADIKERAKRRYLELNKTDSSIQYDDVLRDMADRDYNDMHREVSPLKIAEDAVVIDSTNLNIEQVIDKIISYIE